jgi:hypothetical protein
MYVYDQQYQPGSAISENDYTTPPIPAVLTRYISLYTVGTMDTEQVDMQLQQIRLDKLLSIRNDLMTYINNKYYFSLAYNILGELILNSKLGRIVIIACLTQRKEKWNIDQAFK